MSTKNNSQLSSPAPADCICHFFITLTMTAHMRRTRFMAVLRLVSERLW